MRFLNKARRELDQATCIKRVQVLQRRNHVFVMVAFQGLTPEDVSEKHKIAIATIYRDLSWMMNQYWLLKRKEYFAEIEAKIMSGEERKEAYDKLHNTYGYISNYTPMAMIDRVRSNPLLLKEYQEKFYLIYPMTIDTIANRIEYQHGEADE